MKKIPGKITEIAERLENGQPSRRYRVRAVLKWFGASRRGANVISDIKTVLAGLSVTSEPDLEQAGIDDQIRFVRVPAAEPQNHSHDLEPVPKVSSGNGNMGSNGLGDEQLEPEVEDEQPPSKPDDRPVTSQSSDWTISALRDKLERGQLDLQPKFQREYVWNTRPELPSRLIESLLLEIPIPPIYFGKVSEHRGLICVPFEPAHDRSRTAIYGSGRIHSGGVS